MTIDKPTGYTPQHELGLNPWDKAVLAGAQETATKAAGTGTRALDVQTGGSHYKEYPIQPVEFVVANEIPFLEACVIKRVCRHRKKNGVEDLNKAIHELQLMKELYYGCK